MSVKKALILACSLIVLLTLHGTFAYTVYIDRNFGEKKNCISGYEANISTAFQATSSVSSFC